MSHSQDHAASTETLRPKIPFETDSHLIADLVARHVVPAEPDLLLGRLPHDQQPPVTAPPRHDQSHVASGACARLLYTTEHMLI